MILPIGEGSSSASDYVIFGTFQTSLDSLIADGRVQIEAAETRAAELMGTALA